MTKMLGSQPVPTIRVVSDSPETGGYIVINASDFDETKHVKYVVVERGNDLVRAGDVVTFAKPKLGRPFKTKPEE